MQKTQAQLTQELLDVLTVRRVDDDVFVGQSMDFVGPRVFGGQILAQSLMAAAHSTDKPCHSLHAYFLRPGDTRHAVRYTVHNLRDGRNFSARQITASQDTSDGQKTLLTMIASFAPMDDVGLDYQIPMPNCPSPDALSDEHSLKARFANRLDPERRARFLRKRHVLIKPTDFRDPIRPAPAPAKQAAWLCVPNASAQSVATQQALLVFASDFYLIGTALMGHGLNYLSPNTQVASVDHSFHFHRPFDMGDWLLYAMQSDTTGFDRGLARGQFWQDGRLIATAQQEGIVRLCRPKSAPPS